MIEAIQSFLIAFVDFIATKGPGVLEAIAYIVPMLLVLVVFHEWGHYVTGKWFGVKVLEFGIGYPPRAFGFYTGRTNVLVDSQTEFVNLSGMQELSSGQFIRVSSVEDVNGNLVARVIEAPERGSHRKGPQSLQELGSDELLNHDGKVREVSGNTLVLADMLYSVNWTPLGGFVRLAGESNPAVPRSLASKSVGARAIVLAAGSFMNAVLPIIIFTILFMIPHDVPVGDTGDVTVVNVAPGSGAEAAGIQAGDIIISADGRTLVKTSQLAEVVQTSLGSPMEWLVARDGQEMGFRVTPRLDPSLDRWLVGVTMRLTNFPVERRSEPPWVAIPNAFSQTGAVLVALQQQVSSWGSGESNVVDDVAGPVGIAGIVLQVTREQGLQGWLIVAVIISINLAILNILPIPMLDGGRLLFVGIEWVRRGKRVPPDKEGLVHLIGFVVLIGLIILITVRDIERLI